MTPKARREELRKYMRRHKLTGQEVARLVCRKPGTVYAWTSGQRDVPENALRLLSFGLSSQE